MQQDSALATFLLTDVAGSTQLWASGERAMRDALEIHDRLIEEIVAASGGRVIKARGEGDSHLAVFELPSAAVHAAIRIQEAMANQCWPTAEPIQVRIAVHTGEVQARGGDYYGIALSRAARIRAAGHGGQTLVSAVCKELVQALLGSEVVLKDLGEHRLKDLLAPERIFQVSVPGLDRNFPDLNSVRQEQTNLPLQLTSFVGREQELIELGSLLKKARLITLVGPGGSGKTRLVLQTAAESLDCYEDGVWFVDLAPVAGEESVQATVAAVLGAPELPGRPPIDAITEFVGPKQLLLILDNCEHLGDGPAALVDRALRTGAGITVLCTSRKPLNHSAEALYPVGPLETPDDDSAKDVDSLARFESIALFLERARSRAPQFRFDSTNAEAVAGLCVALGGIPLALELAAGKLRVLSPQQILDRLRTSIDLLKDTSFDADPRHRTLRATIDWSFKGLSQNSRKVISCLSVAPGGVGLELAGALCGKDVFESLEELVEHSLLRLDGVRYRMLEMIRQYASESLTPGDASDLRDHLSSWAFQLAATAKQKLAGEDQNVWLTRLEEEYDNIRASLDWAVEAKDWDKLLALSSELDRFWIKRGMLREGRLWLERALAETNFRSQLRGLALRSAAIFAWQQHDLQAARALIEECVGVLEELGGAQDLAGALTNAGLIANAAHDREQTRAYWARALELYEELRDINGMVTVLTNIGAMEIDDSQFGRARGVLQRALDVGGGRIDKWVLALTLDNIGFAAAQLGQFPDAVASYRQSLEMFVQLQSPIQFSSVLIHMAELAVVEEHYEFGARLLGFANALFSGADNVPTEGIRRTIDKLTADIREAIGGRSIEDACALAAQMTFDEIAQYAMNGLGLLESRT